MPARSLPYLLASMSHALHNSFSILLMFPSLRL
jgi:hypothetical protein